VLVAADDLSSESDLAELLADYAGRAAVSRAEGEADLADIVEAVHPDVVVWEPEWDPDLISERLADLGNPHPAVVMLVPEEAESAAAVSRGAQGVLRRDIDGASLMAAVRAVSAGLLVLDPGVFGAQMMSRGEDGPLAEPLTARELEVLQLLTEGLTNRAIAERLRISENTAKFHLNAILGKLGARNRTEAVTLAARAGLIIL